MKDLSKPTFILDQQYLDSFEKSSNEKCTLDKVQERKIEETIKSHFHFLKDHLGLQKGHVHLLLGRTNKGKSALIESLILENICSHYCVLLYLSEGDKSDLKRRVNAALSLSKKMKTDEEKLNALKKLHVLDSNDLNNPSFYDPKLWINELFQYIRDNKIEVLYFDNFSTCAYGDANPELQSLFFKSFCDAVKNYQIPTLGAIHQSKGVASNCELEIEHIRGNSAYMNSSSFVYGFNNYCHLDPKLRILKVLKSRLNGDLVGSYYELKFRKIKNEGFYSSDKKIGKDEVQKLDYSNKSKKNRV